MHRRQNLKQPTGPVNRDAVLHQLLWDVQKRSPAVTRNTLRTQAPAGLGLRNATPGVRATRLHAHERVHLSSPTRAAVGLQLFVSLFANYIPPPTTDAQSEMKAFVVKTEVCNPALLILQQIKGTRW